VNGLTLLVLLALGVGIVVAWRAIVMRGRRDAETMAKSPLRPAAVYAAPPAAVESPSSAAAPPLTADDRLLDEQARLVRSLEAENAALHTQLSESDEERRRLLQDVAAARAETARYREIVVALEDNALPPLLDGPNAPDDLKLIVGVGPVLERMLHQLGVTTYRQIARWSERDIDEFDAKLPEFPGRIRRDTWVTQARELHQSKFGEALPMRDR
jgi:predicted flap endonuclease-1-like 5' DNA nuclease